MKYGGKGLWWKIPVGISFWVEKNIYQENLSLWQKSDLVGVATKTNLKFSFFYLMFNPRFSCCFVHKNLDLRHIITHVEILFSFKCQVVVEVVLRGTRIISHRVLIKIMWSSDLASVCDLFEKCWRGFMCCIRCSATISGRTAPLRIFCLELVFVSLKLW